MLFSESSKITLSYLVSHLMKFKHYNKLTTSQLLRSKFPQTCLLRNQAFWNFKS